MPTTPDKPEAAVTSAAAPGTAVAKPQPLSQAATPDPEPKTIPSPPEAKTAKPKAEGTATESKPDEKSAELKPDAKATRPRPEFRNKIIFTFSVLGILAGLVAAYLFSRERKAQPPVFAPVASPYGSAIYANGIVESDQPSGENINIYPEVSGPITQVLVQDGQQVMAGDPLFTIEDSVQRATTAQLRLQSEAALTLLEELKAQPRVETLAVAKAQVDLVASNLKAARDQYDKRRAAYDIDPRSISKDAVDTAQDAADQAAAGLEVAQKQYDLTKAGAWRYDLVNQEKQYQALQQAYNAANALLRKYSVKAPVTGVVLAVNAAAGSYVSSLGAYASYTKQSDPLVVMGTPQEYLAVRCYVDEILISRLPSPARVRAEMSLRGSYTNKVPLNFVRVQPYVSPKIELANERQEQVDLRVLPVIFRFQKKDAPVYPGQLVDVYIGSQ